MNSKSLIPGIRTAALIATFAVGLCCARAQSGTNAPWEIDVHYRIAPSGYTAPADIVLWALLNQSNVVDTVQFFANAEILGTVTNSIGAGTSSMVWTNASAGDYELTAVVSTSEGIMATSQPVSLSITEAPTNAPPAITNPPPPGGNAGLEVTIGFPGNGGVYTPPANFQLFAVATETNADEVVQFFANSNLIATVTNLPGSNVFVAAWANIPVGGYALTAVVSTSDGSTATSPTVFFSVSEDTNPPPVAAPIVALASPTNASAYLAPADVGLEATWSAGDPTTAATVQFFANSNLITTVSNGPGTNTCFAAWTNVAAGTYNMTAVLTYGISVGSSAPAVITVSDDSTNGPVANVAPRSQLPVVGVFPGNPTIGAQASHVVGGCVYISIAAPNGMAYSLESSTDLINWSPVFTNTAVNGGAQYVAPNGSTTNQFYRIVPAKP